MRVADALRATWTGLTSLGSARLATPYPALRKLQYAEWMSAKAGETDTGPQKEFYAITRAGRTHRQAETEQWDRATRIVARFVKDVP